MLLRGVAIVVPGNEAGLSSVDGWLLPWLRERGGETGARVARRATIAVALIVLL